MNGKVPWLLCPRRVRICVCVWIFATSIWLQNLLIIPCLISKTLYKVWVVVTIILSLILLAVFGRLKLKGRVVNI